MKIHYYDDKKEKQQSHEFTAENDSHGSDGGFHWHVYSYGKNKGAAIAELKKAAVFLRDDIQRFLDSDLSETPDLPRNSERLR